MGKALGQGLIDWRSLQQLSDGDRQFERELLSLFVSDTRSQLSQLSDAVMAHDAQRVAKLAHYLKGSCGNVGVIALHACAAKLEAEARRGELSSSQQLLIKMMGLFQQVQAVLGQM
jgi:histidine phosphotransfer protein HptB